MVVPTSTALSKVTVMSCCSAIQRAMERPRPEPPVSFVREESTIEPIKNARLVFGGNADAVIGERYRHRSAVLREGRCGADVSAGRCIFYTVVEEDAQELSQQYGVHMNGGRGIFTE